MVNVLLVTIFVSIFVFPSWAVKPAKDFSQSHDFSIGHYVQNRDDSVKSDQTVDVALTSVFIFQEKLRRRVIGITTTVMSRHRQVIGMIQYSL